MSRCMRLHVMASLCNVSSIVLGAKRLHVAALSLFECPRVAEQHTSQHRCPREVELVVLVGQCVIRTGSQVPRLASKIATICTQRVPYLPYVSHPPIKYDDGLRPANRVMRLLCHIRHTRAWRVIHMILERLFTQDYSPPIAFRRFIH